MIFLMLRAHAADREVLIRPIADTYTFSLPTRKIGGKTRLFSKQFQLIIVCYPNNHLLYIPTYYFSSKNYFYSFYYSA